MTKGTLGIRGFGSVESFASCSPTVNPRLVETGTGPPTVNPQPVGTGAGSPSVNPQLVETGAGLSVSRATSASAPPLVNDAPGISQPPAKRPRQELKEDGKRARARFGYTMAAANARPGNAADQADSSRQRSGSDTRSATPTNLLDKTYKTTLQKLTAAQRTQLITSLNIDQMPVELESAATALIINLYLALQEARLTIGLETQRNVQNADAVSSDAQIELALACQALANIASSPGPMALAADSLLKDHLSKPNAVQLLEQSQIALAMEIPLDERFKKLVSFLDLELNFIEPNVLNTEQFIQQLAKCFEPGKLPTDKIQRLENQLTDHFKDIDTLEKIRMRIHLQLAQLYSVFDEPSSALLNAKTVNTRSTGTTPLPLEKQIVDRANSILKLLVSHSTMGVTARELMYGAIKACPRLAEPLDMLMAEEASHLPLTRLPETSTGTDAAATAITQGAVSANSVALQFASTGARITPEQRCNQLESYLGRLILQAYTPAQIVKLSHTIEELISLDRYDDLASLTASTYLYVACVLTIDQASRHEEIAQNNQRLVNGNDAEQVLALLAKRVGHPEHGAHFMNLINSFEYGNAIIKMRMAGLYTALVPIQPSQHAVNIEAFSEQYDSAGLHQRASADADWLLNDAIKKLKNDEACASHAAPPEVAALDLESLPPAARELLETGFLIDVYAPKS